MEALGRKLRFSGFCGKSIYPEPCHWSWFCPNSLDIEKLGQMNCFGEGREDQLTKYARMPHTWKPRDVAALHTSGFLPTLRL